MPHKKKYDKNKKNSKRIVVDADVARSASDKPSTDPTSGRCRDVLMAILGICHRVVMTKAIVDQWNDHQSRFAGKWRKTMAQKGKILRPVTEKTPALRAKVTKKVAKEAQETVLRDFNPSGAMREKITPVEVAHEAMLKDFHLLEAAMIGDQIVISRDKTSQCLFAAACQHIQHIGGIGEVMWTNPDEPDILDWLQEGARIQPEKQLKHYDPNKDQ